MPFGRWRGKALAEIEDRYLRWLVSLPNLSDRLRQGVEEELARRETGPGDGDGPFAKRIRERLGDTSANGGVNEETVRAASERAAAREAAGVDPQIALALISAGFAQAKAAQGPEWETPEVQKLLRNARDWLTWSVFRFMPMGARR